jgi:condensin complex subunit 3
MSKVDLFCSISATISDAQMAVFDGTKQEEDSEEEEDNPTASRFTAHLLHWLFDGFLAKDKNVRFRVLQNVAEMIAHLGAIEYVYLSFFIHVSELRSSEDDYKSLRAALIDRLVDRESVVRYQAVISLAKLCGTEDDSELAEGETPILDILLRTMAQDESAWVDHSRS